MATITGTSGNDTIQPGLVSPGVTGGTPTAGDDSIQGLAGNDSIDGGDGNDTIDGGSGSDSLRGGGGNDLVIIGLNSEDIDYAYGDAGNDELQGRTSPSALSTALPVTGRLAA
ncbi:MAG: calcium-binding protein, partial [Paracraurococcus sp.]